MRICDWSSDVCSSDLAARLAERGDAQRLDRIGIDRRFDLAQDLGLDGFDIAHSHSSCSGGAAAAGIMFPQIRSEEHTSELQSLMRISYAVFCLKKKTKIIQTT